MEPAAGPISPAAILALAYMLRDRGMTLGVGDVTAMTQLAVGREDWTLQTLSQVLSAVIVKHPADRRVFESAFSVVFGPTPSRVGAEIDSPVGPTPPPPPLRERLPTEELPPDKPPPTQRLGFLSLTTAAAWVGPTCLIAALAIVGLWSAAGSSHPDVPSAKPPIIRLESFVTQAVVAAAVASLITGFALWVFSRRGPAEPNDGSGPTDTPEPTSFADATVFRIGSLGGDTPPFLDHETAERIVELFNYRIGEPDKRLLDVAETLRARAAGDPAAIVHAPRRELPVVAILADVKAPAAAWNTLADEFGSALLSSGIAFERVEFAGSLFVGHPRRLSAEGLAFDTLIASPGWTVTAVFAELHRLSVGDIALLRRAAENGPVLVVEYRDPALWDNRHRRLAMAGLTVVPAIGSALREGLASIFAPDRSGTRARDGHGSRPQTEANVAGLPPCADPDIIDWAGECALVQPISLALADQLRSLHPSLAGEPGRLAFSRLAAMQGSWTGPEGLRFQPALRAALLTHHVGRSEAARADAAAVIDAAFGDEPSARTAGALWRYARAKARLFSANMDGALDDILDLGREGLIDGQQIDDLFSRLSPPSSTMGGGTIPLPREPGRLTVRRRISGSSGDASVQASAIPAQWQLGLPESRTRILYDSPAASEGGVERTGPLRFQGAPSPSSTSRRSPICAAFLTGAQYLAVGGADGNSGPSTLSVVDTIRGTRSEIDGLPGDAPAREIWAARDVDTVVIASAESRLFFARRFLPPSEKGGFEAVPGSGGHDLGERPVVAIAPDGSGISARRPGAGLALYDLRGLNDARHVSLDSDVTALAYRTKERLLVALRDGSVGEVSLARESGDLAFERLGSVDGTPAAIAALQPENASSPLLVATEEGRVLLMQPGTGRLVSDTASQASELADDEALDVIDAGVRLPWSPRRVVPFLDKPAVVSDGREIGISLGVFGRDGQFEIVGIAVEDDGKRWTAVQELPPLLLLDKGLDPLRDEMLLLAISAQSRRVAALRGGWVEVRPLTYDSPEAIAAGDEARDRSAAA